MTRTRDKFGVAVAEGSWLYAETVPGKVRVLRSDVAFGTGDFEHEPEAAADRPGVCFYVVWEAVGGGPGGSIVGPFPTLDEAKAYAQQSADGLRWFTTIAEG